MLNDKQSLMLCGVLTGVFFVSGVLDILNNYAVKTILAILFLTIVCNFVYITSKEKK